MAYSSGDILSTRMEILAEVNSEPAFFRYVDNDGHKKRRGFKEAQTYSSAVAAMVMADEILEPGWFEKLNACKDMNVAKLLKGQDNVEPGVALVASLGNIINAAAKRDCDYVSGSINSSKWLDQCARVMERCRSLDEGDNLIQLVDFLNKNTLEQGHSANPYLGSVIAEQSMANERVEIGKRIAPTALNLVAEKALEEAKGLLPVDTAEGLKKQKELGTNTSRIVASFDKWSNGVLIGVGVAGMFAGLAIPAVPLVVCAGIVKLVKSCTEPPRSLKKFIHENGTFDSPPMSGKPSVEETYRYWQKYMNEAPASKGMWMNVQLKNVSTTDLRALAGIAKTNESNGLTGVDAFNAAFKTMSSSPNPSFAAFQKLTSTPSVFKSLGFDASIIAATSAAGLFVGHFIAPTVVGLAAPIGHAAEHVVGHFGEKIADKAGEKAAETISDVSLGILGGVSAETLGEKLRDKLVNRKPMAIEASVQLTPLKAVV